MKSEKRKVKKDWCQKGLSVQGVFLPLLIAHCSLLIFSCAPTTNYQPPTTNSFASFRDVPGITAGEIAEIETLKEGRTSFIFGVEPKTTEAVVDENGEIVGFSGLLCGWLTEFFGIPFIPEVYSFADIVEGLRTFEIDFTASLSPTEERRRNYFITDSMAHRSVKCYSIAGRTPPQEIWPERPARYVMLEGAAVIDPVVSALVPGTYEMTFISNNEQAYALLKDGTADAYITQSHVEGVFDVYGDVVTSDFLPLIFQAVPLSTQNPALQPVISVVQKMLQSGGLSPVTGLYDRGHRSYQKQKFSMTLTEDERARIAAGPVVPFLADPGNYPVCFYNAREKEWQGIAFDLLDEISTLTGLSFVIANDENAGWPGLYEQLLNGDAVLSLDLIRNREREAHCIWTETATDTDYYALISRSDYPDISINGLLNERVGLARGRIFTNVFNQWFPHHPNTVEYDSMDTAVSALRRGEVDLVMTTQRRLLHLTHYQELSGYKANLVFDRQPIETRFAFIKHEALLYSVVDKALTVIDTQGITDRWMRKTYDYRIKVAEARSPLLIGGTVLSFMVIALMLVLFLRGRSEENRLAKLVEEKTSTLKEAEKEAKSASEAKSHFIANMSHEMRTPMNVIIGLTDLMLEEGSGVSGKVEEELKKINTAGTTLMGLINDVLDISKIESGKMDLSPVEYAVPSLLNDIITLNIVRIGEKPITFNLDIDDSLPQALFGDDLRVKQVLNNLLSNAFKYTQSGTVTLNVECDIPRSPVPIPQSLVWVTFSVSDTGMGIREDDIAKLFTDYNQVDTSANRKIEGTGLGLSITKKFVEMMGGEITVESEYGKGTTFRARILQGFVTDTPITKETVENLRGFRYTDKKRQAQGKVARADLSYARVLVVDDFPMNLDVAASMLRKYKMQVDCVQSGQEAVDRIKAGEPVYNVVFMDHMMPGMDGVEATKLIRALGTGYAEKIPIIALTANAVAGSEKMFLENGFNAFLPKPFNAPLLDSVIKQWIRQKSSEQ